MGVKILGKKEQKIEPREEEKEKKEGPEAPVLKLAEPVRRILEEKETKIKSLEKKLEKTESETRELKTQLDKFTAEKKKLTDKLAKVEGELKKAEEGLKKAKSDKGASLEDLVYAYVLGAGGEISYSDCAKALGIKNEQVKQAINELMRSGKLAR
jgi:chromosome segregation ATPase